MPLETFPLPSGYHCFFGLCPDQDPFPPHIQRFSAAFRSRADDGVGVPVGREAAGPDGHRESLLDVDFGLCVSSSESVCRSCLLWTESSGHGGRGPALTEGLLQTEEVFPSGVRLQLLS